VRKDLDRRLVFVDFAEIKFISALHGTGVGDLFPLIDAAYRSAMQKMSTPELTRILEDAISTHQPPLVSGRRVKLRYAHAGGHNPPLIVIHGKQTKSLPGSYSRFLQGFYRKALRLVGTPIRIVFKDAENPYK
jgi:GTP-binding protein